MEHSTLSPHIKTVVMRRVKGIWFLRRALPLLVTETIIIAFVLQKIAAYVFVNQVIHNAAVHTLSRSPFMMADFFFRAFMHTEFLVQLLLIASVASGALLAYQIYRAASAFITSTQRNFPGAPRVTYV